MMFAQALFALFAVASPPDSLLPADSLLVELRKGGYTIVWRHTATDRTVQEPMDYQNTPRFRQRNLTDRGIADAKVVGVIFKSRGIPIGDVISSPMFRTRETAEYAFGRVTDTPVLRVVDPNPEQRRLIAAAPAAGTNRVLVTHHFVIERNVPGVRPGMVDEGEAAVVRRVKDDSVQLVGIFKMADWQRLGAQAAAAASASTPAHVVPAHATPSGSSAPLVIPALLQTPERAAIAEYFRVFNSGDDSRMRLFYEKSVVPNPDRTMDQRIEVFQRLKGMLGTMSIVSASVGADGSIEVKAASAAGAPTTVIFSVEPQAPYRLKTISFQRGGSSHP
jgi:phosphohistidine phosphatase SixA